MLHLKTKYYTAALIILADIILVIFLFWCLGQLISLSDQNAQILGKLEELTAKKSKVSLNKVAADRSAESVEILNKYFISSEEKVLALDALEKLASKSGINYTLNNATDGERVMLDISVKGSYGNIYYFIKLLENSDYWVSFEKISLSRGVELKAAGAWSGSLVVGIPTTE